MIDGLPVYILRGFRHILRVLDDSSPLPKSFSFLLDALLSQVLEPFLLPVAAQHLLKEPFSALVLNRDDLFSKVRLLFKGLSVREHFPALFFLGESPLFFLSIKNLLLNPLHLFIADLVLLSALDDFAKHFHCFVVGLKSL